MQQGRIVQTALEKVIFGIPAADAIGEEVERLGAESVFLMVSRSLNTNTDEIDKVRTALGNKFAGEYDGMPPHSPRDAVCEAAAKAREANADLIVTVGGGSLTDGAKVVQLALANGVEKPADLDRFRVAVGPDGRRTQPDIAPPRVRQVTVPTTLSGGEFNPLGGCTDTVRKMKEPYSHPLLVPRTVILDPAVTVHTPEWMWLSTGIRSVDHCVETLSSLVSNDYCDGLAAAGLELLSEGLPRTKADPGDIEARLKCQIGVWHAMSAVIAGVPMGASHAIGHILGGTCDVPHGYTSCVMLPYVMQWNEDHNAKRQARVSQIMGAPGTPASEVLDRFIGGLGLPRRLADVGVDASQFDIVAKNSMHDIWIHGNPRPIKGPDDVMEILKLAA